MWDVASNICSEARESPKSPEDRKMGSKQDQGPSQRKMEPQDSLQSLSFKVIRGRGTGRWAVRNVVGFRTVPPSWARTMPVIDHARKVYI